MAFSGRSQLSEGSAVEPLDAVDVVPSLSVSLVANVSPLPVLPSAFSLFVRARGKEGKVKTGSPLRGGRRARGEASVGPL